VAGRWTDWEGRASGWEGGYAGGGAGRWSGKAGGRGRGKRNEGGRERCGRSKGVTTRGGAARASADRVCNVCSGINAKEYLSACPLTLGFTYQITNLRRHGLNLPPQYITIPLLQRGTCYDHA